MRCGRPPRAAEPRRPPPRRAALPARGPRRPGLGIKPAARAAAPGGSREGGVRGRGRPPRSAAAAAGPGEDSPRARPPACGARSGLLGATVLGAEDRPGSAAAAAAGSKCGSETGREGRGAQRLPPPPRARHPGPRRVFICHTQAGGQNYSPPPEDGRGRKLGTARARPQ
jgi:hypothetical protein